MPETKFKPKNKRKSVSDNQDINKFLKSQIFSVCVYMLVFLISCVAALIVDSQDKYDYYISLTAFSLASLLTGFYAGNLIRKNGLIVGMLYSLPANLIVLLISLIINSFSLSLYLPITAVSLLISSALGGVLAVNKRHRR